MNTNRRGAELVITEYIDGSPLAMYDLGVGINSEYLTLQERYPNMELFGCEPHPEEFARLKFPGKLAPVAIDRHSGRTTMYMRELGSGGSSLLRTSEHPALVDVWTLDQFDEWAGKPDRILLWMDIEGAELRALIGGHKLMSSNRVHWISLEAYDEADMPDTPGYPSAQQLTRLLETYGYRFVREYNRQGAHFDMVFVLAGQIPGGG